MSAVIDKMRADWRVVSEDRRRCNDWSESDEKEFAEAIKAAVASGDDSLIVCWARWLADLSAATLLLQTVARGVTANIRAAVAESKVKV